MEPWPPDGTMTPCFRHNDTVGDASANGPKMMRNPFV